MSALQEDIAAPKVAVLQEAGPVYARVTGSLQRLNSKSKNNRYYPESVVRRAVDDANKRLLDPTRPIQMLVRHGSQDEDRPMEVVGRVTKFMVEGDQVRYDAEIPNTSAGRDMANLLAGGFHNAVSLRSEEGAKVRQGLIDGKQVSVVEEMRYDGVDFTLRPGMGQDSRVDSVHLFESVDPAKVQDTGVLTERAEMAARGSRSWYALVTEAVQAGLVPITGLEDWCREYLPILERKYQDTGMTAKSDRAKIAANRWAGRGRTFPIQTAQDVLDASRLIGYSDNPEGLRASITEAAVRGGLPLPPSWVGSDGDASHEEDTAMSGEDTTLTEERPPFLPKRARDEKPMPPNREDSEPQGQKTGDPETGEPNDDNDEEEDEEGHGTGLTKPAVPPFAKGKRPAMTTVGPKESMDSMDDLVTRRVVEEIKRQTATPDPAGLAEALVASLTTLKENDPLNPGLTGSLVKAHDTIAAILGTKCTLGDDYLGTGQGGRMKLDIEGDMRVGGKPKSFENHKGPDGVQQPGYSTHESVGMKDLLLLIEAMNRRHEPATLMAGLEPVKLAPDPAIAALTEAVKTLAESQKTVLSEIAQTRQEALEMAERTALRAAPGRRTKIAENADAAPGSDGVAGAPDMIAMANDRTIPSQTRRFQIAKYVEGLMREEAQGVSPE